MKKLFSYTTAIVCLLIAIGITHGWSEPVMYILFTVGFVSALLTYFLNECCKTYCEKEK